MTDLPSNTADIPAEVSAIAKNVRARLCLDCECTFDDGCGCIGAISEAIMADRAARETPSTYDRICKCN